MSLPVGNIVTVTWLYQQLLQQQRSDIVVLDASAFMPNVPRDPYQEFIDQRIPSARFFDFNNKIAAPNTELPHMLPSASLFEMEVAKLGINKDSHVVIYDSLGMFSAPRGWWMFKTMGHDRVSVLDGGLPAWLAAHYPTTSGQPSPLLTGDFKAHFRPQWVIDADTLCSQLEDPNLQILDARPTPRFLATVKEPRVGLRSGHMPHAKSLPFAELLVDGHYLPVDKLQQKLASLSLPSQQLIFSCGSGVTACILALAANTAGYENITVYDGSWTEWGANEKYPVVS